MAAYCISKMGSSQQVKVFQTLSGEPRYASMGRRVLEFTKFTNEGVRNIITGSNFNSERSSMLSLLSYIRCFFEAQIRDQSLYEKIIRRLNGNLILTEITLSPLDCMSVGYFLAFILRNSRRVILILSNCGIDDHSIGLMMGELSKYAEACPEGALHRVTELDISKNKIGDNGIAHIATALQTNTTMRTLNISWCGISDEGAESLARALAVNRSLQDLNISDNEIGDNGIAHIATALQTNTTMTKLHFSQCSISDEGAESLARALAVNRSLQDLNISDNEIGDNGIAHIATALQTNTTMRTLIIRDCSVLDEGALSLAAALTANSSMEHLQLYWSSTHPDSTLKKIGKYVRTSNLNRLELVMNISAAAEEKAMTWLKCVEVGGKKLIQSLDDSRYYRNLRQLCLELGPVSPFYYLTLGEALRPAVRAVNTAREKKGLPNIRCVSSMGRRVLEHPPALLD